VGEAQSLSTTSSRLSYSMWDS